METPTTRSALISVVGRPNVGKSSLVNAMVGEKVSITSARPQTTRNTIRGVLTRPDLQAQLVFVDTPGLHRPKNALGERLNKLVYGSLEDTDLTLFVLAANQDIGPGDRLIAERLRDASTRTIVALNKTDIAPPDRIAEQLTEAAGWDMAAYVPVSALTGDGLDALLDELLLRLQPGPFWFPPDMHSDQPDALLAAERVREKYLRHLRDELPHSLAVVVDDMVMRKNDVLYIKATVYVERSSQKGIVIGKGGALLKRVGEAARTELESLFGTQVYLELRVKVEADWQRKEQLLDRLGFGT